MKKNEEKRTLRAYKFALDPNKEQTVLLAKHAGAARFAYNFALGIKEQQTDKRKQREAELIATGVPEDEAKAKAKIDFPYLRKPQIQKLFNETRGDTRTNVDGIFPWHHEVSTYAFQSAWANADAAEQNWLNSLIGKRKGPKVGFPAMKKKVQGRGSFRLHHNVKKPTIRLDGYRRVLLPRLGSIRIHDNSRRLSRVLENGALIQSATIRQECHRWYVSLLVSSIYEPAQPTQHMMRSGSVGVDWGVHKLITLSKPIDESCFIENPRHLKKATCALKRAQRIASRREKGSRRRSKANRRVAKIYHLVAQRRSSTLHYVTKRLTTNFNTIAIEDLNIAGMTRSAHGTMEKPGTKVRQKAGLNRSILDTAPGELRRQLTYKSERYGSSLLVHPRYKASSKICSKCGWYDRNLTLANRTFECGNCGLSMDRDLNAAYNIEQHSVTSPLEER